MGKKVNPVKVSIPCSPAQAENQREILVYKDPELSTLVKEGRKKYHLTQTELAQRTGITITEISRIESGNILKPSRKVLKALSPYTGISYSDLLFCAGYSGNVDEPEYYDLKGERIGCEDIIDDIYSADADLLSFLKGIDSYTTYEDTNLLKIILALMKKTHDQTEGGTELTNTKRIFSATKNFLSVHLKELLKDTNYSPG